MKRFKLFGWFILRDRDLYRLLDKSYSDGFTNGCAAYIPKTLLGITFSKIPSVLNEVVLATYRVRRACRVPKIGLYYLQRLKQVGEVCEGVFLTGLRLRDLVRYWWHYFPILRQNK